MANSSSKKKATKKTDQQRKPASPGVPPEGIAPPARLVDQLRAMQAIGRALATTVGLDALLNEIVPHVSALMGAERTTLFLFDPRTEQIWSKVAQGEETNEIRLSLGQGIAGWVARHRETVNIPDAYSDDRFNPRIDAETGFRTRSVAAVPLVGRDGQLLAVLQVLNHKDGPFTDKDIDLLRAIGGQTSYAVENAQLAQQILDQNQELEAARLRAERRRAELDLLYQLEQETSASTDLKELLNSIIARLCERMRSETGSVLLTKEEGFGTLFFKSSTEEGGNKLKELTIELGEGVIGWVGKSGEAVVVNRPEEDPRHNQELARRTARPANALLAVPLVWDQRIIGAAEVINPRPRHSGEIGYDLEDLKVLTLIAGQVARAVALTRQRQARLDTQRLAIVGRMLASVAHDLRNPMTAISGYAQLMAIDEDMDTRQERCDRILAQIDEMTAMVSDLLAFAKGDSKLHPATVSVVRLAREFEDTLRLQCEPRGIDLTVSAAGEAALIDVSRAKRILFNIAKNALDVLGAGGHLAVAINELNGGLKMVVTDDGPGIPDEIQARLFEPFVSSGKTGGTGIGLSIVKRFVQDHGGSISVESAPDRGTTFVVRLSRADNAAFA